MESQARKQVFYGEVRSNASSETQGQIMGARESLNGGKNGGKKSTRMDQTVPEAQVSGVGELSCLRLHFERFEKLGISQTFNLQKSTLFTFFFFRMAMQMQDMMSLFKKEKRLKIRIIRRFDA